MFTHRHLGGGGGTCTRLSVREGIINVAAEREFLKTLGWGRGISRESATFVTSQRAEFPEVKDMLLIYGKVTQLLRGKKILYY